MSNPSKIQAKITMIKKFDAGVYQVDFSLPTRFTKFKPGQFLHLTLDDFDPTSGYWPESRVFSIASEPRTDVVSIVYSVKGSYTTRMQNELSVGRQVWLKFPYGDFVVDQNTDATCVLVAGGTGVAPYVPFLKSLKNSETKSQVHLYYGVREPSHLLFIEYLLPKNATGFVSQVFIEHGELANEGTRPGRLSIQTIRKDLEDKFNMSIFYLSGPPVMIKKFSEELHQAGINSENIRTDEWE